MGNDLTTTHNEGSCPRGLRLATFGTPARRAPSMANRPPPVKPPPADALRRRRPIPRPLQRTTPFSITPAWHATKPSAPPAQGGSQATSFLPSAGHISPRPPRVDRGRLARHRPGWYQPRQGWVECVALAVCVVAPRRPGFAAGLDGAAASSWFAAGRVGLVSVRSGVERRRCGRFSRIPMS